MDVNGLNVLDNTILTFSYILNSLTFLIRQSIYFGYNELCPFQAYIVQVTTDYSLLHMRDAYIH